MKLREVTRKLISSLEEKSGYLVQVTEEPALPTLATIRIAKCAQFIDALPEVGVWVRNIDSQPKYSFWLQTLTGRFYPDFVCRLTDGRYLVVEYKGDHL